MSGDLPELLPRGITDRASLGSLPLGDVTAHLTHVVDWSSFRHHVPKGSLVEGCVPLFHVPSLAEGDGSTPIPLFLRFTWVTSS